MSTVEHVEATVVRRRMRLPGALHRVGWLGTASVVVVSLAVFAAAFGSLLAPYDPNSVNLNYAFVGPFDGHLLGMDGQGRDLLSRLLVGARTSMVGPLAVVVLSSLIGGALALLLAWRGGLIDQIVVRVLDVLLAFPGLLLAILVVAVAGPGLVAPVIALSISYVPYFVRVLRGAAMRERQQPYVEALQVQGFGSFTILVRHILPNLLPLALAQATVNFAYAMVDLAALSYLGLGVQQPTADWGSMVFTGQAGIIQGYPAESLAAGACIVLVICAFNILGERLADRGPGGRS